MAKWPRLTWPPQPSSIVRPTPTTAKMTTSDNRNSLPALLKYGSCGTTRPMTTAPTASQTRLWRTSRLVRSDAGTRVTGTSSTAAPDVSNTRAMALPRTSTINRMRTNTASSAFGALDVWADTSWPTSPRIRPPASACGRDTKAPKAAAPRVNIRRFGPRDARLKLACVGAVSTAEMADSPPAIIHVTALTRRTEMPERRAASGLLAAARICLPSRE